MAYGPPALGGCCCEGGIWCVIAGVGADPVGVGVVALCGTNGVVGRDDEAMPD